MLYVIEVQHPLRGPLLVGPWYTDKATCQSFVPFVKAAYHGLPTRTRAYSRNRATEIQANGGQPSQRTAPDAGT